jgi:hypothetical protein
MSAEAISKWIGIVAALGAIWARFIALEEARDNQVRWITELSGEMKTANEHIAALERDRAMLERVHQIELRLGSIEERTKGQRR